MKGLVTIVLLSWCVPSFAGECEVGAPANDCDADGVLDTGASPDRCPFTANVDNSQTAVTFAGTTTPLPTGSACTHATASVDPSATLGFGVSLGAGAVVSAKAVVGDYAQLATSGSAFVGARSHIAAADSPARGTVMASGVIGRSVEVGEPDAPLSEAANVVLEADVLIGRSSTIGADTVFDSLATVGYGSTIGRLSQVGAGTVIGNLAQLEDDVDIGAGTVLARQVSVGTESDILDSVIIGPSTGIGPTSTIGAVAGASVRIRKDAVVGAGVTIEPDVRFGRGSRINAGATVRTGTNFRANVLVGDGATVGEDVFAGRASEICADALVPDDERVASEGFYPLGTGCVGELVVLNVARGGGGSLDPVASNSWNYRLWLTDTGPSGLGANVTAVNELTDASMNGAQAVILLMDNQVSNPVLSASERSAVGRFVRGGGGLVVFFGFGGTDSIGSEFGFTLFHGPGNNSGYGCWSPGNATPTAAMPPEIEFGPYGTVGSITWDRNCHENIDLGVGTGMVALASGLSSHDIAMIPPGALEPGSGPVITFLDQYTYSVPGTGLAAGRNATAYAMGQ